MENKNALGDSLDVLLERYLNLLDQYQALQQDLRLKCCEVLNLSQFSSKMFFLMYSQGYIALAKANFNNPHNIRHGQDFYDRRMQASTQVYVGIQS